MLAIEIWAIAFGLVLIAGVSKRVRSTIFTLPMLYTLFGLIFGLIFRDFIRLSWDSPLVEVIATITLVLVLATDASRIKLNRPLRNYTLPLRLLGISLPLTILLGTIVGIVLFSSQITRLGLWEAAILAVILAPTDASLGQSVVSNPRVPARIRQALNIESGLNDGIAMPFLILAVSLAVSSETQLGSGAFLGLTGRQVIYGAMAGLIVGFLGARYIQWGEKSAWMSRGAAKICWLALIIIAFGAAELFGGNGFIAAFVFGIVSGRFISADKMLALGDFAEIENALLMLVTYIFFGMVLLLPALEHLNWSILIYTLLSLTVIRMLPIAISLLGTKLKPLTVLFMGWFGPRGIASILYVLTVVATEDLVGKHTIYTVAMFTVFMSILLHGLSAAPLSDRYGKRIAEYDYKDKAEAEMANVPELPTRVEALPKIRADARKDRN